MFPKNQDTPLPPTTTVQQDIVTAGQRRINLIWEYTQAIIAIMLVGATIVASIRLVFYPGSGQDIPNVLAAFAGMVVGSYFQRTNHLNIGGVGSKPTDNENYVGR